MAYASISKPGLHFNTKLYAQNASTNAITGVGFQPDWTWIKNRDSASRDHRIFDAVRGANKPLKVNGTNAEASTSDTLNSFDSDGFTLGADSGGYGVNDLNGNNTVAWNWKAGTGQGSSNTDGSINTTYTSVNTTAGFSISQYTGNGTYQATVGHGLGAVPKMIIVKGTSFSREWVVYHESMGNTKNMHLNDNSTQATEPTWGNTTPTSSVFTISGASEANWYDTNKPSETYIAYCFAEKKGYSKFGSYVGNNSDDGTFIYTGFKPAFVMTKSTTTGEAWNLIDNKRINNFNPTGYFLYANNSNAENTTITYSETDFLSNGFKLRKSHGQYNGTATHIYMAFAEEPLVVNVGQSIPATAR